MPDRSQVIIRIVPGGGTKTLQQIINQLEYLSRKGKLELQRSARHLDTFVPPDEIRELALSWVQETGTYHESRPDEERQQELTTHIIVSFPAGTSQVAAYAASREWAAEMFGSGAGGGRYNYLTAFHIDRDHPHLHVVVNRRELLGHGWLKISRRHPQLNYDALRITMAEISLRHGVVLEATSRAERGISERPMTFAQYRRLERQQANQIRFEDIDFEEFSPGGNDGEPDQSFNSSYGSLPQNVSENLRRNGGLQSVSEVRSRALIGSNGNGVTPDRVSSGNDSRSQSGSDKAFVDDGNLRNGPLTIAGDGQDLEGRSGMHRLATEPVTHTTSEDDVRQRPHRKRPRGDEEEQSGAKLTRVDGIRTGVTISAVPVAQDDPITSPIQPPGSNPLDDPGQTNIATDALPPTADRRQQGEPNSKRPRDDDAEPSIRKRSRDGRSQGDEGNRR
ncbi:MULTISPECIES: T-DNA border endonuclease VirD2 [Rhizobium/Agrobacterium group]|uniref:Rcorf138 n=4 Tax=Rhizobium/Agrobacterium group TaxID=227290 RepID=A8W0J2_RHIRH|nr:MULTISPECIES: T-DNA border endonuclease VirD2 [Rhizobium/Agrobacterium group]ABW33695.1 rcorf138 [Rhizobium rhizogenes]AQS65401.1 T-DNA border endonuclease VirD2 [Rhizobium rhizogenes]ASK42194.1 type VI secretion protein [Rhizobium rhizogenes]MCZ7445562.1 T-DNA border endonuclease VirD2 [Rhizobium rhizogenes]MCZ7472492.1 T-DNA border endonuclease VirD2 [Rhizobium rhizogenes]